MPRTIAIAGAGVGGLAAAIALRHFGHTVDVFERTSEFRRVGADLQLSPNIVLALDHLGLRSAVEGTAARTTRRDSRAWDTGEVMATATMGDEAERRYGAPQLMLHRADLLKSFENAVPGECIHLSAEVVGVAEPDDTGRRGFLLADGRIRRADVLVAADGIHSIVREWMLGPESPTFTGVVSFRSIFPADKIRGHPAEGAFTKWWGPTADNVIVSYPLTRGEEMFVFATIGQPSWTEESWTLPGEVSEFREMFAGFHRDARSLIDNCETVLKSALYERDPLPTWSKDNVTLLGDACHPMLPFMAQGAGSAIEDSVILARCLSEPGWDVSHALQRYAAIRKPRTSRVQLESRANTWFKDTVSDVEWVYGYKVWDVPLADDADNTAQTTQKNR